MILRRITEHVKAQNWFAVGLDFLIVVVGVFFGIQIGNWNEIRLDQRAYEQAHDRMVTEARANIKIAQDTIEATAPFINNFKQAVEDIRACRDDKEAKERIDLAIKHLDTTIASGFRNSAIVKLTTADRLLERQTQERREQYANYSHGLRIKMEWHQTVMEKMEARSDDLHPFLDYSEMATETDSVFFRGKRSLVLAVPVKEACTDDAFRKILYKWEGGHGYQITLMNIIIKDTKTYLEELGENTTGETL